MESALLQFVCLDVQKPKSDNLICCCRKFLFTDRIIFSSFSPISISAMKLSEVNDTRVERVAEVGF